MSFAAWFLAVLVGGSGASDVSGTRFSALMIWVPAVLVVCALISWGLVKARREKIAIALCALPFLYFGIVLIS